MHRMPVSMRSLLSVQVVRNLGCSIAAAITSLSSYTAAKPLISAVIRGPHATAVACLCTSFSRRMLIVGSR